MKTINELRRGMKKCNCQRNRHVCLRCQGRLFDIFQLRAENQREYERCNADFHDAGGLMGNDHFSL